MEEETENENSECDDVTVRFGSSTNGDHSRVKPIKQSKPQGLIIAFWSVDRFEDVEFFPQNCQLMPAQLQEEIFARK